MNKELRIKVIDIARSARKWTELKASKANYRPDDLCGWCAISAGHLFRELSNADIPAELHYTSGHCYVVIDDYIVDVTATQFHEFKNKEINIIHIKEAEPYHFYRTTDIFKHPSELREHQIRNNWPRRQICLTR